MDNMRIPSRLLDIMRMDLRFWTFGQDQRGFWTRVYKASEANKGGQFASGSSCDNISILRKTFVTTSLYLENFAIVNDSLVESRPRLECHFKRQ